MTGTTAVSSATAQGGGAPSSSLSAHGIVKRFPGVVALSGVDFSVTGGEVHALVGENGAGKSTLIKILAGIYRPDEGTVSVDGVPVQLASARHAQISGISVIPQEPSLIPNLTVAENAGLGREPLASHAVGRALGKIAWRQLNEQAAAALRRLGVSGIEPNTPAHDLSVAQQRQVEIARVLTSEARFVIMDEPTTPLASGEVERLLDVVRTLRDQGIAIVYISHRFDEVFAIADRITVLRDGQYIGTRTPSETSVAELVRMMVGRPLRERTQGSRQFGPPVLRVANLGRRHALHDISFVVRRNEIVGVAGLLGAGRTELARAVFGADRIDTGTIEVDGATAHVRHPADAIQKGIALVPEERKRQGLIQRLSVRENVALPNLAGISRFGRVSRRGERQLASDIVQRLDVRPPGIDNAAQALSGGNQQKVVLAKWLCRPRKVYIFDEPTKGIDIAAKEEIYALIRELAAEGAGVLMISSELPELLGLCDRLLVMRAGRIVAEFDASEATQERIMLAATGGSA